MILERMELRDYKGFSPQPIYFEPDVTVFVGPNDAGKSNLLRALEAYRYPRRLDVAADTTKGTVASEGLEVSTTWFIPGGPGRGKKTRQLTGTAQPPERVSLWNTPGAGRVDSGVPGTPTDRQLRREQADTFFPQVHLLDLSDPDARERIPAALDNLEELNAEDSVVVRRLLEAGGCHAAQLLRAPETRQREMLLSTRYRLTDLLRALIPSCPEVEPYATPDRRLEILFRDERHEHFRASELGSGLTLLLATIVQLEVLAQAKSSGPPSVLLLDEPETGLHPAAQAMLRQYLQDLAAHSASKRQIVYATPSPFMIDPNRIHQVRLVGKEGTVSVVDNKPYRRLHEEPIQSALQLPLGYSLFLAERNVLVEGMSDQMLLVASSQACAAQGLHHLDLTKTSVIPCGGAGENEFGNLRVRATRRGARAVAVYDRDPAGFDALKKAREADCQGLYVTGQAFDGQEVPDIQFIVEDLVPSLLYRQAFINDYGRVHESLREGAILPEDLSGPIELAKMDPPILARLRNMCQQTVGKMGYEFRKFPVAKEAAILVLENIPAPAEEGGGQQRKQDLRAAAALFRILNQKFTLNDSLLDR